MLVPVTQVMSTSPTESVPLTSALSMYRTDCRISTSGFSSESTPSDEPSDVQPPLSPICGSSIQTLLLMLTAVRSSEAKGTFTTTVVWKSFGRRTTPRKRDGGT